MATGSERMQRGIQSIEIGGQLLRAMVHRGAPMALKDLAREADMTPAKAHPYMVSFGRLGLIEQDGASGHYLLGPLALQLGLIGLQQADPIRIAAPLLEPLAREIGQTVAIAVWGSRGATIVQIAEAPSPVHVSLRHGTVFSPTRTASGRVFAAYLAPEVVRRQLDAERARERQRGAGGDGDAHPGMPAAQPLPSWAEFEVELREVRARGASRSTNEVVPGVSAMAAPVFDAGGAIVLAMMAIGPSATFDTAWNATPALAIRRVAAAVTQRLGSGKS
jgi:DNA-binding IclR family transcriptional regulator